MPHFNQFEDRLKKIQYAVNIISINYFLQNVAHEFRLCFSAFQIEKLIKP